MGGFDDFDIILLGDPGPGGRELLQGSRSRFAVYSLRNPRTVCKTITARITMASV